MRSDIDKLVDKLFSECRFDPAYMDEQFTRKQIKTALELLDDVTYEYIYSKYFGSVAYRVGAPD